MLIYMTMGVGAGQIPGPDSLPFSLWPYTLTADAREAGVGLKKDYHSDWSMFLILSPGGRRGKK